MRQPHSHTVVMSAVSRSEASYLFPADNLAAASYLSLLRDEYTSTSKLFFPLHFSTQSFVCRIAMSSSLTLLLFLVALPASYTSRHLATNGGETPAGHGLHMAGPDLPGGGGHDG